jgi:hypothetical protein
MVSAIRRVRQVRCLPQACKVEGHTKKHVKRVYPMTIINVIIIFFLFLLFATWLLTQHVDKEVNYYYCFSLFMHIPF